MMPPRDPNDDDDEEDEEDEGDDEPLGALVAPVHEDPRRFESLFLFARTRFSNTLMTCLAVLWLLPVSKADGCGDLGLRQRSHLVGDHQPRFRKTRSAAARQPQQPQRDHTLNLDAEPRRLKHECEP